MRYFRTAVEKYFEKSFWSPQRWVSTLARWRSLLDHRRGGAPPQGPCRTRGPTPPPRRTSTRRCVFAPHTDPKPPRHPGLDTRSLALAARPPEGPTTALPHPGADRAPAPYLYPSLRLCATHGPEATAPWSRHSLAGARCLITRATHRPAPPGSRPPPRPVPLPVPAPFHHSPPVPRRTGLDTRSLALAARPPEGPTTALRHPGADRHPAAVPLPVCCVFHHPGPEPRGSWSRHSLAGARCSTTGGANHSPAPPGSRPRPRAVPLPVAASFRHPRTRSRDGTLVSTLARWRSLLDHRTAAAHPQPAPYPCRRAPVRGRIL